MQNNLTHKTQILFEEMIALYEAKLLVCARRIVPHIVEDDLWQPNDFPELENHPEFRYEEGFLAGLRSAYMAFNALNKKMDT